MALDLDLQCIIKNLECKWSWKLEMTMLIPTLNGIYNITFYYFAAIDNL